MSKTTAPAELSVEDLASQIKIVEDEKSEGRYAKHVQALIAADNPLARLPITVKTDNVPTEVNTFQKTANALGKTALRKSTTDNGDGTTTVEFALTEKRTRTVKPKDDAPEVGTEADAETEDVAAV
jgi:hypothetical protein